MIKSFFSFLFVIFIVLTGAFYYIYTTHPVFNHPLHWLSAYSPQAEWLSYFLTKEILHKKGKDGGTALHYAVRNNPRIAVTNYLISAGANVNALDQKGHSPLYYVVTDNLYQKKELFLTLIKNKADLNQKDKKGLSLLHYIAGSANDITLLKTSFQYGADIRALTPNGDSIWHIAVAENPHINVIKWLLDPVNFLKGSALGSANQLEQGSNKHSLKNIDIRNNNQLTLLHKASAKAQNPEVIKWLLKKGADKKAKDKEGSNALHWALGFNPHKEIARALVAGGVDVNALNKYGDPPLLWGAAHSAHPEVLREVIFAKTFQPEVNGRAGSTALHRASAQNKNPSMIRWLVQQGWSVDLIDDDGNTPLHYSAGENPSVAVLNTLLTLGADVNKPDHYGNSALHLSAKQNKSLQILNRLISAGAKVHAVNKEQDSPLHYAVSVSFFKGAKALLAQGAKVNVRNKKGESPLHLASAFNTSEKLALMLIEAGADVNAQDNKKQSPLHRAVKWGYREKLVNVLLQKGANACLQDAEDRVPADYAEEYTGLAGRLSYQKLKNLAIQCGI